MRRGTAKKFSFSSMVFLLLAAIFNLISYTFDQIIVQDEDHIRNLSRNLQIDRNNLNNLNSSINFLQDLAYDIDYETNKLLTSIAFNAKAYATFNNEKLFEGSLILDLDNLDKDRLSKLYKQKLVENIEQTNLRIENLYRVFKSNFSAGLSYDLIKDTEIFKVIENQEISKIPNNLKKDYFKQGADRYLYYTEIYNYIAKFKDVGSDLEDLGLNLQKNFSNNYVDYFTSLEKFSSDQNNTNYYILLSIFSQILGLTFLLFLFRNLIYENI